MRQLSIYIASSWKNQHAVEMLTDLLRERGHRVLSFVENNHGEQKGHAAVKDGQPIPFESWVWSDRGERSFAYDTNGASFADAVIYLGPSGCDAWAEVGCAWSRGRPIYGLWAKGEQVGLMRRMMKSWSENYREVLYWIQLDAAESDADREAAAADLTRAIKQEAQDDA